METREWSSRNARLELIVEDGGNGNASDWGIWLDPKLLR